MLDTSQHIPFFIISSLIIVINLDNCNCFVVRSVASRHWFLTFFLVSTFENTTSYRYPIIIRLIYLLQCKMTRLGATVVLFTHPIQTYLAPQFKNS